MKINWWPWGVLTLVSLVLLSFFVLYPLAVLFSNSVVHDGGGYSLAAFFTLAPRFFRRHWFEYGMTDLGQAMGMTATGLLLNRLVDPLNRTGARESFAYNQLAYEPFMGGGIVTAFAVVAIATFGSLPVLIVCTIICIFWIVVGLLLGKRHKRRGRQDNNLGRLALTIFGR